MRLATWTSLKSWLMIVALLASVPVLALAAHSSAPPAEPCCEPTPPPPSEPCCPSEVQPPPSYALDVTLDTERLFLQGYDRAPLWVTVSNHGSTNELVTIEWMVRGDGVWITGTTYEQRELAAGEAYHAVMDVEARGYDATAEIHVRASNHGAAASDHTVVHVRSPPTPAPAPEPRPEPRPYPQPQPEPRPVPPPVIVFPEPAPLPCFRPYDDFVLRQYSPCGCPCGIAYRPVPACPTGGLQLQADGSFLLTLVLRGHVADGKLVIDLDPEVRAQLGIA